MISEFFASIILAIIQGITEWVPISSKGHLVLFSRILDFQGRGIEFDAQRYEWLGVPAFQNVVCALTKASGITNLEEWKAASTPVKLGGMGVGTPTDDTAKVLKEALGLPIQLVSGYKGLTEVLVTGCRTWGDCRRLLGMGIDEIVVA